MINKVLKVSALVLVLGAASGCANTEAQNEAMTTANSARDTANAARSAAEAARAAADSAAQAAANAQRTADRALAAAQQAQNGVDANRDRMQRMFEQVNKK